MLCGGTGKVELVGRVEGDDGRKNGTDHDGGTVDAGCF